MDKVRVLRILEYVGDRDAVEYAITKSIQGERNCGRYKVRAATIGNYPEILVTEAVKNELLGTPNVDLQGEQGQGTYDMKYNQQIGTGLFTGLPIKVRQTNDK